MLNNWLDLLKNNRAVSGALAKHHPKLLTAFRGLNEAQGGTGTLDAKTRELIALAVAVTTRCEGCIASHAQAARAAGVTEAELAEALSTAIALNAGAAYVYSLKAMDAHSAFAA
ncbi:carboxymuconolactone decarboxylase family protein [Hydrogenophaga sp. OTU3427]|uniref:carboxymuconolactone decarboxylase family protein n=1 Tax=Hydrogenophaga sp. OTU3427 TaxID=3043856 RepID=UPI00313EC0D6